MKVSVIECRRALEKAVASAGRNRWAEHGYVFVFDGLGTGNYTWKGKPLHITPHEALYLYERLVQGKKAKLVTSPQSIATMRRKFGLEFLREVLTYTRPKRAGRKSDFYMEVTGQFTRQERGRFEEIRREALSEKERENREERVTRKALIQKGREVRDALLREKREIREMLREEREAWGVILQERREIREALLREEREVREAFIQRKRENREKG